MSTAVSAQRTKRRMAVGRRYLSLDSLAPLLKEQREHADQEGCPHFTAA